MGKIKLKPKARKGVIKVKAIVKHPMETGFRKDKKGEPIPANHIDNLTITHNGNKVVDADIGAAVSKDPYFQFQVAGAKGDEITLAYTDNNGGSGSMTAKSK
jgi:sulfur-oxidizing protein SoxZ